MKFRVLCLISFFLSAAYCSYAQDYVPPPVVFHPNQQVRIRDFSPHTAHSSAAAAVLAAALETVFHNEQLCCRKNSALEDRVLASVSLSLRDLGGKLQGRWTLSSGRPIMLASEYLSPASIGPEQFIAPLMHNQPYLMQWNSRLFVVYGVVFDESIYSSGQRNYVIQKLLLFDPQHSAANNEITFDRQHDDWKTVQGLLLLKAAPQ